MGNRYVSTLFKSGEEFEEFLNKLSLFKAGVESGEIVIPKASQASKDGDGNNIPATYAKTADLTSGKTIVAKATNADKATEATTATKATQDGGGNNISDTYAKKSDLTDGTIKVKNAVNADKATTATRADTAVSATSATKATQDGNSNNIYDTYARKIELTSGTLKVKSATNADSAGSATKATQDGNGNVISSTYATTADLISGNTIVGKATNATNSTNATYAMNDNYGKGISATYAKKADIVKISDVLITFVSTRLANFRIVFRHIVQRPSDDNFDLSTLSKVKEFIITHCEKNVKYPCSGHNGMYLPLLIWHNGTNVYVTILKLYGVGDGVYTTADWTIDNFDISETGGVSSVIKNYG